MIGLDRIINGLPANIIDSIRKNQQTHPGVFEFGGAEGNRTPDLLIANETLSQLSYDP